MAARSDLLGCNLLERWPKKSPPQRRANAWAPLLDRHEACTRNSTKITKKDQSILSDVCGFRDTSRATGVVECTQTHLSIGLQSGSWPEQLFFQNGRSGDTFALCAAPWSVFSSTIPNTTPKRTPRIIAMKKKRIVNPIRASSTVVGSSGSSNAGAQTAGSAPTTPLADAATAFSAAAAYGADAQPSAPAATPVEVSGLSGAAGSPVGLAKVIAMTGVVVKQHGKALPVAASTSVRDLGAGDIDQAAMPIETTQTPQPGHDVEGREGRRTIVSPARVSAKGKGVATDELMMAALSAPAGLTGEQIADLANGHALVPGMGRRMVAYMIDFSVAAGLGLALLFAILFATTGTQFAAKLGNLFALVVFAGIVNAAHHVFFEGHRSFRGTVGKLIMGLHVVGMDGSPIARSVAIRRFAWRLPSILTTGLLYLMAGRGRHAQALHDRKAGTLVLVRGFPAERLASGLRGGRRRTLADLLCLIAAAIFLIYHDIAALISLLPRVI